MATRSAILLPAVSLGIIAMAEKVGSRSFSRQGRRPPLETR